MAVWNTSKQLRLNYLVHFQLMLHKHCEKQVTLHGSINVVMNTMIYFPAVACVKQLMYNEYCNMFVPVYRAVKNICSVKANPQHLHLTLRSNFYVTYGSTSTVRTVVKKVGMHYM